ncbi:MAG: hypothetical protein PHF36_01640 [Candidatus Cloacimonetes bacterium]|nr:hypothetical protein [Candidatus Cloacimonadota bacterium]MDD3501228.1 hypothetical protein [Candidatus Cloacimonadota bacterium]
MPVNHSFIIDKKMFDPSITNELIDMASNEVKANLYCKQILKNDTCFAMNLILVNCTKTPYSLMNLFLKGISCNFTTCRVNHAKFIPAKQNNPYIVSLETDIGTYFFDCIPDDLISLKPFNLHTYLLPNQAECGWLVFLGNTKETMFKHFQAKITDNNAHLVNALKPIN